MRLDGLLFLDASMGRLVSLSKNLPERQAVWPDSDFA